MPLWCTTVRYDKGGGVPSIWHFLNCEYMRSPVGISVKGSRTIHVDGDDYSELAHCVMEMLMKGIEEEFLIILYIICCLFNNKTTVQQ